MKSNNLEYINHFFCAQIMDIFAISYSYISADVPSGFMARFPEFIFLLLVHSQSLFSTFSFSTSQGMQREREISCSMESLGPKCRHTDGILITLFSPLTEK